MVDRRRNDLRHLGVRVQHNLHICFEIQESNRSLAIFTLAANAAIPCKEEKESKLLSNNPYACIACVRVSKECLYTHTHTRSHTRSRTALVMICTGECCQSDTRTYTPKRNHQSLQSTLTGLQQSVHAVPYATIIFSPCTHPHTHTHAHTLPL